MSGSYIDTLQRKIVSGVRRLPPKFAERHLRFLRNARMPDGGFSGRAGATDLYYTNFGLLGAEVLGVRSDDEIILGTAACLTGRDGPPRDIVECFCLLNIARLLDNKVIMSDAAQYAKPFIEKCRTPEGGYSMIAGENPGVYHTFLAALCYDLAGGAMPDEAGAASFVLSRRQSDGGFMETVTPAAAEGSSGVNPTAAAAEFLLMAKRLDGETSQGIVSFMTRMQTDDGGFAAHQGSPCPDLMSTFTALVALARLEKMKAADLAGAGRFVRALSEPDGGFRGTVADTTADVEYTYYGMGAAGLLAMAASGCGGKND